MYFSRYILYCKMINQYSINDLDPNWYNYYQQLRQLFQDHHVRYFCDFDGTITLHTCLLYAKYKYLYHKKWYPLDHILDLLLPDVQFNPRFFTLLRHYDIHEIVVVTGNYRDFVERVISYYADEFARFGVRIIGVVWSTDLFHLFPKNKYRILPDNALYIADMFEWKYRDKYHWFVCVDNYSRWKYLGIYLKKLWFYFLFLMRHG